MFVGQILRKEPVAAAQLGIAEQCRVGGNAIGSGSGVREEFAECQGSRATPAITQEDARRGVKPVVIFCGGETILVVTGLRREGDLGRYRIVCVQLKRVILGSVLGIDRRFRSHAGSVTGLCWHRD